MKSNYIPNHSLGGNQMGQFALEQVIEALGKIKELQNHYISIIRTRDGLLPRNLTSAVRELVRGDMDKQWEPLIMAQVSTDAPLSRPPVFELAGKRASDKIDQHMSGATRMFIDTKQDTIQIGMQILCEYENRELDLIRAYSTRVPQYRQEEDRNYLNVSAAEPSMYLSLLNYVQEMNLKVLGWIAWPKLG
jgi:hypothetical protein